MVEKKCSRAVAHIPGGNIKEFLGTIRSEPKRQQIPRLSKDGEFLERKDADQKFFSVSGMGFGQQPLEPRGATFPEFSGHFGRGMGIRATARGYLM
jgi:hypothetical protein